MGGSRDPLTNGMGNLICLCRVCHDWIERHRADAYRDGWLVHRWEDPGSVPILLPDGWELLLTDDGGAERTPVSFLPAGISANHRMHWSPGQEAHWGSDAGGVHAPASLHRTQSPCFI